MTRCVRSPSGMRSPTVLGPRPMMDSSNSRNDLRQDRRATSGVGPARPSRVEPWPGGAGSTPLGPAGPDLDRDRRRSRSCSTWTTFFRRDRGAVTDNLTPVSAKRLASTAGRLARELDRARDRPQRWKSIYPPTRVLANTAEHPRPALIIEAGCTPAVVIRPNSSRSASVNTTERSSAGHHERPTSGRSTGSAPPPTPGPTSATKTPRTNRRDTLLGSMLVVERAFGLAWWAPTDAPRTFVGSRSRFVSTVQPCRPAT